MIENKSRCSINEDRKIGPITILFHEVDREL